MKMLALVRPSHEPYADIIPENTWGFWIRSHIEKYIQMGWTLIEDYEPSPPAYPAA